MDGLLASAIPAGGALLALLCGLYVFYNRIAVLLAWSLHAAFVLGLLLASSALWVEPPYRVLGVRAVERSGIPTRLREGDALADRLERLPQRIYERVRYPFTDPPEPLTPRVPPPGPLERSLLPGLERFATGVLRTLGFALGLGIMAFALLWRSTVDMVLTDRALQRRIQALERRPSPPIEAD